MKSYLIFEKKKPITKRDKVSQEKKILSKYVIQSPDGDLFSPKVVRRGILKKKSLK